MDYNEISYPSDNSKKHGNGKARTIVLSIITFFVGVAGMYLVFKYVPMASVTNVTKTEKEVTVNENGIADSVEKIYDAVVTVETYMTGRKVASGTGFVYKVEGGKAFVLTNSHVIEGGDEIHLHFTNDTSVVATIIGSDVYSDIAVLRVEEESIISVAEIGNTKDLRVGDTLFTVGAPLGSEYSWTVTRGILSAKDRMIEVSLTNLGNYIMKVVQTDAAINSGNSGGPLANSNGEVIGITSMKLVSNGVEGMGFAIPIEDAMEYANKIENNESLVRPYLGVTMLDDIEGVLVSTVEAGSPAANGGLRKGDFVLEIAGNKVTSSAQLKYYLYKCNVGDTITLKIKRNDKEETLKIKLGSNS